VRERERQGQERRRRRRLIVETLSAGRYRVERTLGQGGMAAVYLAQDSELERPVAIKVLAEHLATDEAFRQRFLREARMAAKLSHPNVVHVYDQGDEDGQPFIVMEYVDGPTLGDELKRSGPFPPARVVDLALQICGGLEHAHSSGLVHRDIKPGNLLLREDGTVKIADFGIARAAQATKLTQIGSVLGTAAYLAPEQAAGEPVTAAADIYSLGCVLFELLTGRTPYVFETLPELVVKQREEPITPIRELRPDVPPELEAAVMHCLARRPQYRPASAAALAQELAAGSPEPPTEPLPAPSGVRATDVATVPLAQAPSTAPQSRIRVPRRAVGLPRLATGLIFVAVAALVFVVLLFALASGDGGDGEQAPEPTVVERVPPADNPSDQARNLAEWLRDNAR
jgi:eukaryotic-like serine/threonine-protein kinase